MKDIKELADPAQPVAACAAPSSEEVEETVRRLYVMRLTDIAKLVERLAARVDELKQACDKFSEAEILAASVPDGYVVVPREPTPKMDFAGAKAAEDMMSATMSKSMGTLGGHVVRDDYDDITLAYVNDEISSAMGIYKAMIAAYKG